VRSTVALAIVCLSPALFAEDQVRETLNHLGEQARNFAQVAPQVVARETLRQRALKPYKRRFAPHSGPAAEIVPEWQSREIESEYGFALLGAAPGALREFRTPVAVDGQPVHGSGDAAHRLALSIRSSDDVVKRRLLEDFEKLGLIGTVTDFGQVILLFDHASLDHYDLQLARKQLLGADHVMVFKFRQLEGPGEITIWENGKVERARIAGEIWVSEQDGIPLRVTMSAIREQNDPVREEAEVDYAMSAFGAVLPVAVVHREYRKGQMTAENRFTYGPFRKFSATTEVTYPNAAGADSK
jgi:hypothetical protein